MSYANNPYKDALASQDASNPLALVTWMAVNIHTVYETENLSTDQVAQHPIMVMYLTQLVHLCMGVMIPEPGARPGTTWAEANKACEVMAQQWEQNRYGSPLNGPFNINQVAHGALNAANLASILLLDDEAHRSIQSAAQKLLSQQKGQLRFIKRYSNGMTQWRDPSNAFTGGIVTVEAEALALKEVKDVPSQA